MSKVGIVADPSKLSPPKEMPPAEEKALSDRHEEDREVKNNFNLNQIGLVEKQTHSFDAGHQNVASPGS